METLWKNNLNIGKNSPMIYINLIVIVFIVYEKKSRRTYSSIDLRLLYTDFLNYIGGFSFFRV